jgi:RimJ/RimL family protein N-acetyltransferase
MGREMSVPRQNDWGQPIGPALPGWKAPAVPPRQVLRGAFCEVVPLDPERHARELFRAFAADPDARRWTYLPYGPFADETAFRAWIEASAASHDPLFFAILGAEGSAMGLASYLRITPLHGSIEVGHLNFSASLQQRPAATEALYLMMKNAFELGYRRYEWKCDTLNQPSRAAAQRLGMSFEGVFRQAIVYKGRSRDTAWYAAIDSDWSQLERAYQSWLAPENFDASGLQRSRLSELTAPVLVRQG